MILFEFPPRGVGSRYIKMVRDEYDHTYSYSVWEVSSYNKCTCLKRFPTNKLPLRYKNLPIVYKPEVVIYPEFEDGN